MSKRKKVSNPFTRENILDYKSRQEDACKDDVFLAFKANENLKVCTMMNNLKHLLFVLQQPIFIGWD